MKRNIIIIEAENANQFTVDVNRVLQAEDRHKPFSDIQYFITESRHGLKWSAIITQETL